EDQAGRLAGLSHSAQEDISRLNETIEQSCDSISRNTQTAITDLTNLEDRVTTRVVALESESSRATKAMESVAESLEKTATGIEPIYLRAVEEAMTAQDRLERLRGDFDETTMNNFKRLNEIGEIFDTR